MKRMAHSGSTLDVATRDARHYFGMVPVTLVLRPMFTLLSSRKPSLWIATDDRSVSGVLATETAGVTLVLVSMSVIRPVSGSPPTSTLLALITRSQVEKVIVSLVCGPWPTGKELAVTVKVHTPKVTVPKVTPPLAKAAEPNLASVNNVVIVPDEGMKVNATGLLPIPGSKTDPSGIVNCGGNDPSKATTLLLFRGAVARILRLSPVPPEQANSPNALISTSTATL